MTLRHILALALFAAALGTAPSPARAGFDEGESAYLRKQWIVAIAELRPLVELGDERAAFLLGKMYLDGNGVVPNATEAMRLYRIAAARGHTDAMISIAGIYQGGINFHQNSKLANLWFERAAKLGSQYGAFLYAVSLFEGDRAGTTDFKPNAEEAYRWFRIAATTGAYDKVRDAAKSAAQTASNRLKTVNRNRIDAEVAKWKAADPSTLGPMPEYVP